MQASVSMTGILFAMLVLRPGDTIHRAGFYGCLNFVRVAAIRVYHQSKPQRFVQPEDLGANFLAGSASDAGLLINHWYFFSHPVLLCWISGIMITSKDGMFNYILTSGKMKLRSFHTG
jgi:hypothetical protein